MTTLRDRELLTIQTALGIQFWDTVLARPVTNGLRVTAQLLNDAMPRRRVGKLRTAQATRSGIYGFFGLHPDEISNLETLPPRRALIDVTDPLGRFLPASFEVVIPVDNPFRGRGDWLPRPLMLPEPADDEALGVFLWSAPTRPIAPGLTVVNADIAIGDADNPPPAPFALVQLLNGGGSVHAIGMTDEKGKLTLPMAYPSIPHLTPQPPLRTFQFSLTAQVFCQPAVQTRLPGSQIPDLALLLGQTQAQISTERDPATSMTTTLAAELPFQFGFEEPIVLRTASTDPLRRDSYLRIQV